MNFEYQTNRLIIRVLTSNDAAEVLRFYYDNKEYFDKYEMTRADNFYTKAYQEACLKVEYSEVLKKKLLRFYVFEKPDVIATRYAKGEYSEEYINLVQSESAGDANASVEDILKNRIIGSISLSQIRLGAFMDAMFGYKLDHEYWGLGYAKEMCQTMMEISFDDLKLHRLLAYIMPENERSVRLAKALGFREEGLERQCVEIDGRYEDHLRYVYTLGIDDK